jgi:hypothetical protein
MPADLAKLDGERDPHLCEEVYLASIRSRTFRSVGMQLSAIWLPDIERGRRLELVERKVNDCNECNILEARHRRNSTLR